MQNLFETWLFGCCGCCCCCCGLPLLLVQAYKLHIT